MKFTSALLVCLILARASGLGHVGETEDQIQTRYGAPDGNRTMEDRGMQRRDYHSGGYRILLWFRHGKAAAEMYCRLDNTSVTEEEIAVLLKANGGARAWKPHPTWQRAWVAEDEKLQAGLIEEDDFLSLLICDSDSLSLLGDAQKK